MINKHLSTAPIDVVTSKLKVLLDSVNNLYNNNQMVVESELVNAYHTALNTFFDSLDNSIVNATVEFLPGQPANPLHYNLLTNAIGQDLEALFLEIGSLDRLVTSSFNSLIAAREQILEKSRITSNKINDYLLYVDPSLGAGFFFSDTFNNSEKLEIASSLVETDECFVDHDEGVILLPLEGSPDKPEVDTYIINKSSNGILGNNSELDVFGKDNLLAIGDSEPNTWVEYEKVVVNESSSPLILDLTISLKDLSIINHIHINPLNFGTATPILIKTLETSRDGVEYTSIKDEIPIKDFVPEDEENVFSLSPATSKYAGQGFYSFLPRRAQYIHIVLEQHTPYPIDTINGRRLRYAIGIRDIDILGRKFKTEGSLVSTPFTNEQEIRKVSLYASENPVETSVLSDINHFISEDDGATWRGIQPIRRDGFQIDEIVNYNNISENAISTISPVKELRHKIYMFRDTEAFNENITLLEDKLSKVDIVNMPSGGDNTILLTEEPIEDSIRAVVPFWGSYSCPREKTGDSVFGQSKMMDLDSVDFNVDVPPIDTLIYNLPYSNFVNLKEHIRVFVNNEQVQFAHKNEAYLDKSSDTTYLAIDENSKIYYLNKDGRELQFGYIDSSGNRRGFLPPSGAKISIVLDGDNPQLELTDEGYVLNLTATSDGFKENTSIVYFENTSKEEAYPFSVELPKGKSNINVPFSNNGINIGAKDQGYTSNNLLDVEKKSKAYGQRISKETKTNEIKRLQYKSDVTIGSEGANGIIPPIFLKPFSDDTNGDSISIKEYDASGVLLSTRNWTAKRFIDGDIELREEQVDGSWLLNPDFFSFDADTGILYLGGETTDNVKTIFTCKKINANVLPSDYWEYYKDSVSGRIDTGRISLNSNYVFAKDHNFVMEKDLRTLNLTPRNSKSHNWFNERVVKRTVKPSFSIFPKDTRAIEVPFVDGYTEFNSSTLVENEIIDFGTAVDNIYSFSLENINSENKLVGEPGFGAVKDSNTTNLPVNIFQNLTETLTTNGDWTYATSGNISVYWDSEPGRHLATYTYEELNPGVDIDGLYSIDYQNGILHLGRPAENNGIVYFQTSVYNAFYNIARVVRPEEIEDVDAKNKTILFSSFFSIDTLKKDTVENNRPQFMKIQYEYYKKTTESIKDLEPYFSPICKDVNFRAITADILEEL